MPPRPITRYANTAPVTLSASVDGVELVIAVVDDGPGLRGQTMAQLVQDFGGTGGPSNGRPGIAVSGGARSSGMGIPICARLAALIGGSLLVTDRAAAPGGGGGAHGTAFTLRLPLLRGSPAAFISRSALAASARARGAAAPLSLTGAHVLVVDDSPANRRLALFLLRALGCVGGEVDDGDGVLLAVRSAAAAGTPYDIVLMDIMMERINGDAALNELRAAGERVPVIASTGNATAQDAERYAGLGFAGVLPKPFTREMLHAALVGVLGMHRVA